MKSDEISKPIPPSPAEPERLQRRVSRPRLPQAPEARERRIEHDQAHDPHQDGAGRLEDRAGNGALGDLFSLF